MAHTRDTRRQNLAERWCGQVARRDANRIARRLYRTQVVEGVSRLDEGALLDDFVHFVPARGVMALLEPVQGTAIQRTLVPWVPYVLLYGWKTLCGIESRKALPTLLCSDVALMHLGGFNAPQVRDGVGQRGARTRQGERTPGPVCPDTLAKPIVKLNLRQLEVWFNGAMRGWAKAGGFGKQVTGMVDATDLDTTAP
jgi:hypothetical protein